MTEVPHLTTTDEIAALVAEFRAEGSMPVFSPEEGDETWVYAADTQSNRLSLLQAIVPTPVFKAWQGQL